MRIRGYLIFFSLSVFCLCLESSHIVHTTDMMMPHIEDVRFLTNQTKMFSGQQVKSLIVFQEGPKLYLEVRIS